jgi:HEAT repeat protein
MRKLAAFLMFLAVSCTTTSPQSPATAAGNTEPYGLTVAEEARILAIEDRREYDEELIAAWVKHPNALHRLRIALALARIGPHHPGGQAASDLATLAKDPDRRVREAVAFALGECGDPAGGATLFEMTNDADMSIAAEAAEALSKLGSDKEFMFENLSRYLWMTDERWPEGVRARAVRYLFRFDSPDASNAAMRALSSASSAVRQEAAYSLSRRAHAPARAQLELLLTDPNMLTRAYALAALGRIGESDSARPILNALGDVHPWVRTNAAIALGRVAEKDRSILKAEDLPRVFAALEDPDPGVRVSMVDVLAYYAEKNATALNRLLTLLQNGSQVERELAVGAIPKHFGPESGLYGYPSNLTPWMFVRLFESSSTTASGPSVRATYIGHEDPMVRASVVSTIPDANANAEVALILKALTDSDVIVRANAYDRYAHVTNIPDAERWKTLEEAEVKERGAALNDGRLAAISGLGAMNVPKRIVYLEALLQDDDPVVRRVASDLLFAADRKRRPYAPLPVKKTQAQYEEIVRWSRQPHTATLHMPRGKIEIALLSQEAPMTTWNFAQLAKKNYFDNTSFMRVVPNFVIQGGDPRVYF